MLFTVIPAAGTNLDRRDVLPAVMPMCSTVVWPRQLRRVNALDDSGSPAHNAAAGASSNNTTTTRYITVTPYLVPACSSAMTRAVAHSSMIFQ